MKNSYWIAIAAVTLLIGLIVGYGIWGSDAAKLPEIQQELAAAEAKVGDFKKKIADMESNLGRITSEKLTLEKENTEIKEAMEKATKKRR